MTKKQIAMNFIFFDVVAAGAVCGYACHKHQIGEGWEMVIGGGLAAAAMFVGMILAFMVSDDRQREKRMVAERNFQMQLNQIVVNERSNCAKVAVNMAQAMTNRVANTIVAKYVDGLDSSGKRKNVLEGVNQIVDEETKSLTKALFDELKAQGQPKEKS